MAVRLKRDQALPHLVGAASLSAESSPIQAIDLSRGTTYVIPVHWEFKSNILAGDEYSLLHLP